MEDRDVESSNPIDAPEGDRTRPLLAIVGPTAAGKTEFALRVAERIGAWILSLDSMLVYRGLDVGTAKPTEADRHRVRHELIDLVDARERYDVQRYLDDAAAAEARARDADAVPLYVGGTGLYLKALLSGLQAGPPIDLELRERLERRYRELGPERAHAELDALDPRAAARIHPNDRKRVVRALEVIEQTGAPASDLRDNWTDGRWLRPHRLIGLSVQPESLRGRIEERTDAMLASGWIDEVRSIEAAGGFGPTSAQALGYPEVRAHLAGELDRDALRQRIVSKTWRFSRRQLTWYRGIGAIDWIDATSTDAVERACDLLARPRS